jgi:phosphoglycerate dehydrogenase-like enzyme
LTPHIAGETGEWEDHAIDLFCENLRRYLKSDNLINIVDKKKGLKKRKYSKEKVRENLDAEIFDVC